MPPRKKSRKVTIEEVDDEDAPARVSSVRGSQKSVSKVSYIEKLSRFGLSLTKKHCRKFQRKSKPTESDDEAVPPRKKSHQVTVEEVDDEDAPRVSSARGSQKSESKVYFQKLSTLHLSFTYTEILGRKQPNVIPSTCFTRLCPTTPMAVPGTMVISIISAVTATAKS